MATNKATSDTFDSEIGSDLEPRVIPVIEEQVVVRKRMVESGRVRISKHVTEREELVDQILRHDEVTIERVPVDKYIDAAPEIRYEGDLMIIPVVREELVIQRRLVLAEEIRVKRNVIETHQPQSVTLRKEEIDVRRIAGNKTTGS